MGEVIGFFFKWMIIAAVVAAVYLFFFNPQALRDLRDMLPSSRPRAVIKSPLPD
ncbi:MAG: hypothetical protein ACT4O3_07970 [Elusimicrobiota bacterium]|jgi:hypothetical protein